MICHLTLVNKVRVRMFQAAGVGSGLASFYLHGAWRILYSSIVCRTMTILLIIDLPQWIN